MTLSFDSLRQAWLARDPRERRTLGLGGILIVLLLGYLGATRLGVSDPVVLTAPAAVPAETIALPAIQTLEEEDWRRAASRHGIDLTRLETVSPGLRLEGRTERSEALTDLARWAAERGWWAIDWSLERDTQGSLQMTMTLVAELERLPTDREATP